MKLDRHFIEMLRNELEHRGIYEHSISVLFVELS
ncbi:hypothetical protein [Metabacillus rhizosphaerae]